MLHKIMKFYHISPFVVLARELSCTYISVRKSFGIGFKTDSPYSKPPLITDTRESMSFRA